MHDLSSFKGILWLVHYDTRLRVEWFIQCTDLSRARKSEWYPAECKSRWRFPKCCSGTIGMDTGYHRNCLGDFNNPSQVADNRLNVSAVVVGRRFQLTPEFYSLHLQ